MTLFVPDYSDESEGDFEGSEEITSDEEASVEEEEVHQSSDEQD